ncbi:MAG: hypothetical protein LCH32_09165 [Bacteroidetes bacterium]|nr:hypothetical protein [Bacteroidota bacterium]
MRILIILITIIGFISCKKPETNKPDTSQTLTTTTKIAGVLTYQNINTSISPSNSFSTALQINARFYSPEITVGAATMSNTCDAGTVTANGYQLKKIVTNSTTISYVDTTGLISNFPITYSLNGSSVYTITTFTNSLISIPSISNYNTLPAFISKASAFTFTLADAVNVENAELYIYNIPVSFTNNVVNVPINVLSTIPTATFISMELKLSQQGSTNYKFNGKYFNILNSTSYIKKNVYVTP